jgi:hypothetical protein
MSASQILLLTTSPYVLVRCSPQTTHLPRTVLLCYFYRCTLFTTFPQLRIAARCPSYHRIPRIRQSLSSRQLSSILPTSIPSSSTPSPRFALLHTQPPLFYKKNFLATGGSGDSQISESSQSTLRVSASASPRQKRDSCPTTGKLEPQPYVITLPCL